MTANKTPAQVYLLGALSAGCLALALKAPKLISLPALALLPAVGIATYSEGRRYRAADFIAEGLTIAVAIATLGEGDSTPPALLTRLLLPVGYTADWAMSDAAGDATTPDFWTAKAASRSKIICGSRGSGKTALSTYFAGQLAKHTRLLISDRHYPASAAEWLPGVPRNDFEERYLIRSADDTLTALLNLKAELATRIETGNTDGEQIHLLIDEWGGCWDVWDDGEQISAIKALERINEEGRKFGVNVTLTCHSLTREKTGLDQALTGAADLYLTGDALSNASWSFPSSLSNRRANLTTERLEQLSAVAIAQRVIVFRDSMGQSAVVIAPDLTTPERFEVDRSISDERLEQLWSEGYKSSRKLTDALGIKRSKESPEYIRIKAFVVRKTEPPT